MRAILASILVLGFVAADAGAQSRKGRSTRNRVAEPAVLDPNTVNEPVTTPSTDAAVILRAQILLDRAHFSPGEIDAKPGKNFERALSSFQQARKLDVSGRLDEATLAALNADTAPAIVPYRITDRDVAGPFRQVPDDMLAKSKLEKLAYSDAHEAVGEQFHVSPELLKRLNPGKQFAPGEEVQVPNVLSRPTGKAAKVVVTKAGLVTALDAHGNVIAAYPCSSGSERDPLPIGTWKIKGVARNPVFHYNPDLFWDADPSHSKAKIAPGPNNPVGVVWIDLSKEHYGIHGTPEPARVGHGQSHGCIRLTNWDAMELADLVSPGVVAELRE